MSYYSGVIGLLFWLAAFNFYTLHLEKGGVVVANALRARSLFMVIVLGVFFVVKPAQVTSETSFDVCPEGCLFFSIQTAIDDAEPGSLITVGAGNYSETLKITKDIQLVGESKETTSISVGDPGEEILYEGSYLSAGDININGASLFLDGFDVSGGLVIRSGLSV